MDLIDSFHLEVFKTYTYIYDKGFISNRQIDSSTRIVKINRRTRGSDLGIFNYHEIYRKESMI